MGAGGGGGTGGGGLATQQRRGQGRRDPPALGSLLPPLRLHHCRHPLPASPDITDIIPRPAMPLPPTQPPNRTPLLCSAARRRRRTTPHHRTPSRAAHPAHARGRGRILWRPGALPLHGGRLAQQPRHQHHAGLVGGGRAAPATVLRAGVRRGVLGEVGEVVVTVGTQSAEEDVGSSGEG